MKPLFDLFATPVISFVLVVLLTPTVRNLAIRFNLVDKPNSRKVHSTPIPIMGGIILYIACILTLMYHLTLVMNDLTVQILFIGSSILLAVGVLDDKIDISAKYKLIIQLLLSYYVYHSGIKIDSMYGIFGVFELPEAVKFILTMLVITGCVNALNLIDGIDGLVAGVSILGFIAYTIIAYLLKETELVIVFLTIIGALIGFLRFNLSRTTKIFMGDAGSLVLGYILVISGIVLLQASYDGEYRFTSLYTVIGVLIIPVIDSLRVYRRRIKMGLSPFKADKSHIHHLFLNLTLKHISSTIMIVGVALFFLVFTLLSGAFLSLTFTLIGLIILFGILSQFLSLNNDVVNWRNKIEMMEKNDK